MTLKRTVILEENIDGVSSPTGIPDLWARYSWHRPFIEMKKASYDSAQSPLSSKHHYECDNILVTGYDFMHAMARKSATKWREYEMPPAIFRIFLEQIYAIYDSCPSVFCVIRTQNVAGWSDGWWSVSMEPKHLRYLGEENVLSSTLIQGQSWSDGDGLAIFLGVDWEYHESHNAVMSNSYFQELANMGRFAQSLVVRAATLGLSTRMTPAISESLCSEILALPPERDVLHHVRIGLPSKNPNE